MQYKQNLHTHTTYCDGTHTPEQMVQFAREKGFDSLGFSGHSSMSYGPYGIPGDKVDAYKQEITALKEQYGSEFPIFLGLEFDMYSEASLEGYDYVLGALHYLKLGEEKLDFDRQAATVKQLIDTHFGGDGLAFAKRYYEELTELPKYGKFDILAHFDLVIKNVEFLPFVDVTDKRYLQAAFDAMYALRPHIPLFEVNTGAMARGYRTAPYPTKELLEELKYLGYGAVISSDCHDGNKLDHGIDIAELLLKSCGFTEHFVLKQDGFVPMPL